MSLYLKYRPKTLEDIQGNSKVVEPLDAMLSNVKTCPHVFLLHGPTGTGKTTIGRIIATRLKCKGNDFHEVDSADFRGIDTIRAIRSQLQYKSLESPCQVWLIDECHEMTRNAQSALLKMLEDTPKHVYFVLCTTDPQKLLPTIRGRCSQFMLSTLTDRQMFRLLRRVGNAEGEDVPKEVYDQIINDSLGHPRNALQILDQVLRVDVDQRLEVAQTAAKVQSESIELCRALLKGESWKRVKEILKGLKGQDAEAIRRVVLGYANTVLLSGENATAAQILVEFIEPFYNSGDPGLTLACYTIIN